jgi:hypothetical protein
MYIISLQIVTLLDIKKGGQELFGPCPPNNPGLQARIFRTGIEAGAVLVDVGEVAVADNLGIGIILLQ